ncbi:MAG: Uma2 family endonuclease [Cytophagaceae bacterium]|nr:MAG: Uma2 family endonuclease [Cytophagaceae bacterium]
MVTAEKTYTLNDYLLRESRSRNKHEFYNGKIIRMAGAKARYNQIAANLIGSLKYALRPLARRFIVYNSDQKIYIESENVGVYPDALVICDEPQFWQGREDLIVNPLLVVEVLSRSTASFDRSGKFLLYEQIPSFQEYVLVEQNYARVESWFRTSEHSWDKTVQTDLNSTIQLRSAGVSLPLAEIYEHVRFATSP